MKTSFYLITLILLSGILFNSCTDETTAPSPTAGFTASKTQAIVGEEIQFTNTSTNTTAFRWSFGDGTTSKDIAPKKAYETSGVYLVSLVSTGEGGSTISSTEVKILPSASFVVEDQGNLVSLTAVKFTNTSKGAKSSHWTFGNPANSVSDEESPEFIYLTGGTFTVTLTSTSPEGATVVSKDIVVKAAAPEIYFIDTSVSLIEKLALDGSGTVTNVLDVDGMEGVGLAYDDVHGKIYFSDFNNTGEGKIWKMNLDATGLVAIVEQIPKDPYGIALDIPANKIYWSGDEGTISRANLDGSSPEDLGIQSYLPGNYIDSGIGLDPENNKMYFIDYNDENLHVANLDGSNPSILIPGIYGYAVFVDTVNDKIYFEDHRELKRADLDGNNIESVDASVITRIYGIAIDHDAGKLYWSGRDSGEINIANLDGSDKQILKTGLASPRGIFLRK